MRIGILSDTHLNDTHSYTMQNILETYFAHVDYIIHTGDYCSYQFFVHRHRKMPCNCEGTEQLHSLY